MPAPPSVYSEDLLAFLLILADGTRIKVYESGHAEGVPRDAILKNYLPTNRMMAAGQRQAASESLYG